MAEGNTAEIHAVSAMVGRIQGTVDSLIETVRSNHTDHNQQVGALRGELGKRLGALDRDVAALKAQVRNAEASIERRRQEGRQSGVIDRTQVGELATLRAEVAQLAKAQAEASNARVRMGEIIDGLRFRTIAAGAGGGGGVAVVVEVVTRLVGG